MSFSINIFIRIIIKNKVTLISRICYECDVVFILEKNVLMYKSVNIINEYILIIMVSYTMSIVTHNYFTSDLPLNNNLLNR
jgi:hypothetical protein